MPVWAWGLGGLILLGLVGMGLKNFKHSKPEPTTIWHPTEANTMLPTTLLPTRTLTPVPTLTPKHEIEISSKTWDKDGMEMIFIPDGELMMGDNHGYDHEKPVHTVYLDSYWMDKFEVSNKQYQSCVWQGLCKPSRYADNTKINGADQPVVGVDWNNAKAYCEWAGRRLPTEAEWEKAARGTDGRLFPWGNEPPSNNLLNWFGIIDGYEYTAPVGSFNKDQSPYGVMDMGGNVIEWVSDFYENNYYASSERNNPLGPVSGEYRVLRGGSRDDYNPNFIRSTHRSWYHPLLWDDYIGFRCAASETPS